MLYSGASTLSSRTSGVSSGATSSSRETGRPPADLPVDFITVPPASAVMYQRKYTTLTKPRTKGTVQINRTHSFQAPSAYSNGGAKFVQSEFSAFKVPALPRSILQKESHPNKFLTSTSQELTTNGSRTTAVPFRPLVKNKPTGVKLSRHSSYISGQQLSQLSLHHSRPNQSRQLPAEPPSSRRNGLSPTTGGSGHLRNGSVTRETIRRGFSPETEQRSGEERGRTRNYEPSANDRYWNVITQRVDHEAANRRQHSENPPPPTFVARQRRVQSTDGGGGVRRHSMYNQVNHRRSAVSPDTNGGYNRRSLYQDGSGGQENGRGRGGQSPKNGPHGNKFYLTSSGLLCQSKILLRTYFFQIFFNPYDLGEC